MFPPEKSSFSAINPQLHALLQPQTPLIPRRLPLYFEQAYHKHAYHFEDAMPPAVVVDRALGFLVSDIARLLRRNMDRRLQSLGLTQAQWRAIVHLSRSEGVTQAALAESLEIQPITLTRLIDRMESAGWVERRMHPLDRRAVQLYLTPQSQPILEQMHARAADTLNEATRGVSPREQRQLVATLEHLKHNLIAAETAVASQTSGIARHGRTRIAKSVRARA
jgi:DNA-binding MarR family transcriptional regulator